MGQFDLCIGTHALIQDEVEFAKLGLVIIDERLARRHAERLGMTLTGTLGVLLRAKERGLVSSVTPLVDQLRNGGIWLSKDVLAEALRLADEV